MLKEEGIPNELGLGSTKIHLEIPNEYIESAKRISEEIKSYYKEQGAVPEWTITPLEVLERALDEPEYRYYEENGEPRQFDYDDLFNYPDKVFKHFVYIYQQDKLHREVEDGEIL